MSSVASSVAVASFVERLGPADLILSGLPYPPSINHYWRHVRRGRGVRVLVSEEGRAYRNALERRCELLAIEGRFDGDDLAAVRQARLAVYVAVYPPDRRARDLDNVPKALLDAIQETGVFQDDSQIDLALWRRMPPQKPDGRVDVFLWAIAEA